MGAIDVTDLQKFGQALQEEGSKQKRSEGNKQNHSRKITTKKHKHLSMKTLFIRYRRKMKCLLNRFSSKHALRNKKRALKKSRKTFSCPIHSSNKEIVTIPSDTFLKETVKTIGPTTIIIRRRVKRQKENTDQFFHLNPALSNACYYFKEKTKDATQKDMFQPRKSIWDVPKQKKIVIQKKER